MALVLFSTAACIVAADMMASAHCQTPKIWGLPACMEVFTATSRKRVGFSGQLMLS
jgi:hypothetical protein